MADQKGDELFAGEDDDTTDPRDFLKRVQRYLMAMTWEDEEKVEYFETWLKSRSAAEQWFKSLEAAKKMTWKELSEKQVELEGEKITEAELGTKVKVNGREVYAHVAWANKVEKLVKALVNSLHDTWTTFCGAVRAIRPLDIEEQKERQEKQTWMEGELQRVRQQQRQPPSSPSSVLGPAFRNFSVGSIPKPRFQPVATNTQAPQQQYRGPQRMDAKKLSIIACIPQPHPNTANGWAAYQADIAAWIHSNYGQAAHESRPYPFTPGMSPVASGECFSCRHTGHTATACTSTTRIPEAERTWCQKANSIRPGANATSRANNPNINLVMDDNMFVSREDYDAAVIARSDIQPCIDFQMSHGY
ncbi:hypothetical protein K443DRAFT_15340 [Laccaria amethystina LaAM-08-1]|uniref:CCHC-type domain-containing protein n=1 Tax=Laccaria amethystina LaAM-08-1 TaxID=1095629 RepID=A0A0C9WR57_9AGAR|nr:hypothetical protein K443DRAFT_15340 [Laccaria amethystina LaAM-08-1]